MLVLQVCYAKELKEGFVEYAEEVAKLMVPLLKFYFHDDILLVQLKLCRNLNPPSLRGDQLSVKKVSVVLDSCTGPSGRSRVHAAVAGVCAGPGPPVPVRHVEVHVRPSCQSHRH